MNSNFVISMNKMYYTGRAGQQWLSSNLDDAFKMGQSEAKWKLQAFKRTRPDLKWEIKQMH